ncbi:MAG: nitronate monooxygenase [Lachnospiraceae bacterium]|nr:nitronate monooxygenase [Lachnospiraceae bacterium]
MRLDKRLGIKYPIIQGGMANIATGAFAAAVSNAGGLGLIATGGLSLERLEEEIEICRKLTKNPFGVNLMLMHPQAAEIAEMLAEKKIAVITTGAGNPSRFMDMWKAAGSLVMPVVPSVSIAKRLAEKGADYIIAEGTESGGHVGEMTTMALVPQVVDGVDVPVIAAGGIADGRQMMAAFCLGAAGVQVGTCLLASKECPIHENYKNAVIASKDNDTIVTGRIAGTPVRILKNTMAREYVKKEKAGADKMELENFTLGSLRRAVFDGDTENGSLMAGQVSGQVNEIATIEEILSKMYAGMFETLKNMNEFME